MEDILGSTENTIAKTIRFRLDLPATKIRERERVKQLNTYISAVQNTLSPLMKPGMTQKVADCGKTSLRWVEERRRSILQVSHLTKTQTNIEIGKVFNKDSVTSYVMRLFLSESLDWHGK